MILTESLYGKLYWWRIKDETWLLIFPIVLKKLLIQHFWQHYFLLIFIDSEEGKKKLQFDPGDSGGLDPGDSRGLQ